MSKTLTARRLITPIGLIEFPVITVSSSGLIEDISSDPSLHSGDCEDTLTPTFLDIHTHGAASHDVMDATPAAFAAINLFLATKGVGHYLPTTVTAPIDATLRALESLANAIDAPAQPHQAQPIGIHLEGPVISHAKRGVHPPANILPPDVALFDRFQQAARGNIRLITLAPEIPGAIDLIQHVTKSGTKVSLGHSNATAAPTLTAIAAGSASATHTFNAMRPLDHREPGILGTVLDTPTLFAELICDGIHVDPALVRLWLRAKGPDHAILVTDSMSATGMPDGIYALGPLTVAVADGRCLLVEDGQTTATLAGSVLTLDRAVANLQRFTGASLATAVRCASANPATLLGLEARFAPTPGNPANFNRYSPTGQLTATILLGHEIPPQ
jgi:N-acetylglucosamine-6-phosphate deacetylase